MDPNWKSAFPPHILARGQKYFEQNTVKNIRLRGNTFFANVTGTDTYSVEIDFKSNNVDYMECNCPYAINFEHTCKHMAAVLFALEAGVPFEEMPSREPPAIVERIPIELPWLEAIEHLPENVIRKKLIQLADRDDNLKERLVYLYLGGLPEGQLQNWKAEIQQLALEASNRHGEISWENADIFFMELKNFISSKLSMLRDIKAIMDAYRLVWIALETAIEQVYAEPDGSLQDFAKDCEDAWDILFDAANEEQRKQMLEIFWNYHRNINWDYAVDGIEIDSFFLSLDWTPEQNMDNLRRLQERIAEAENDGSNHAVWNYICQEII